MIGGREGGMEKSNWPPQEKLSSKSPALLGLINFISQGNIVLTFKKFERLFRYEDSNTKQTRK